MSYPASDNRARPTRHVAGRTTTARETAYVNNLRRLIPESWDYAVTVLREAFRLPHAHETAAIALGSEKTAALFFDLVWAPYPEIVPNEFRFSGLSREEIRLIADLYIRWGERRFPTDSSIAGDVRSMGMAPRPTFDPRDDSLHLKIGQFEIAVARELMHSFSARVTPVYSSATDIGYAVPVGTDRAALVSLLSLAFPVEAELTWSQVRELRADGEATFAVRKLLKWYDATKPSWTAQQMYDYLGVTLDKYHHALKRHGISTKLFSISGLLGTISVSHTVTALSSQSWWAALLEGICIGGLVTAKIVERHVTSRPEPPDEIAWLYEIEKKATLLARGPTSR